MNILLYLMLTFVNADSITYISPFNKQTLHNNNIPVNLLISRKPTLSILNCSFLLSVNTLLGVPTILSEVTIKTPSRLNTNINFTMLGNNLNNNTYYSLGINCKGLSFHTENVIFFRIDTPTFTVDTTTMTIATEEPTTTDSIDSENSSFRLMPKLITIVMIYLLFL